MSKAAAQKGAPSAVHGSFTIVRELPHAPGRVYAAWSEPKAKAAWFSGPSGQWTPLEREMDFRVGGRERAKGRWTASGVVTDFQAHYLDIVPLRRIVYAYNMHLDDKKISVSLATIELEASATGTRMKVTEQGAFLDGYDAGSREHGTGALMDALAKSLERAT